MADRRAEILQGLADAVIEMDEGRAVELAHQAIAEGIDAYEAISEGLSPGMDVVSEKYDNEEYFVPEILLCSDAMYAAIEVLKPHLKPESARTPAKIVIGVIEGDTHDIGKNIVRIMLDTAGFEVHDLGRDVPVERFVAEARRVGADVIAVSTLMSTTREGMRRLVERLVAEGVREQFKVLIGGPPVSSAYCREIGADAYGGSAPEGVRLARELAGERK
jgi:corrinoid protein of di/trimethylamine methyltransferase